MMKTEKSLDHGPPPGIMESHRQSVSTVLVTGAAGYIGSVLVPELLARGYRVRALDRFFFGRDTLPADPALTLIREDSRCLTAAHMQGVDAVIDLAAISNDPAGDAFAEATDAINHRARVRTAQLARDYGVSRYLLPSSCSVYGYSDNLLTETSPTRPLTRYAGANKAAEDDILPLAAEDFTVIVLRQATVFGPSPRMRYDLAINAMVYDAWETGIIRLMRDGKQFRPFLHVNDAASALCHFLGCPSAPVNGRIFNVGSADNTLQLGELAKRLQRHLNERLGNSVLLDWYGDPDHRSYRVDFSRIERLAGWRAHHGIPDGCDALISRLEAGELARTPRTRTLDWYRRLESNPPPETVLHGGILDIKTASIRRIDHARRYQDQ